MMGAEDEHDLMNSRILQQTKWMGTIRSLIFLVSVLFGAPSTDARAQEPLEEQLIHRFYERGLAMLDDNEHEEAVALADSLTDANGGSASTVLLGRWLRNSVVHRQGNTADAFKAMDSLDVPRGINKLVRYAIEFEKAADLKELDLHELAMVHLSNAFEVARMNSMERETVDCLALRSEIYRRQAAYDKSLADLVEAEPLAERIGYHKGVCTILINKGNVLYYQKGREKEALVQYQKALALAEREGLRSQARKAMKNIGSVTFKLEGPAAAILFYREALGMNEVNPDQAFAARALANIGAMYNKLDQHVEAKTELMKAIRIQGDLHDTLGQIQSYHFLSRTYEGMGRLDSAVSITERTIDLSRKAGNLELLAEAEGIMTTLLRELGMYKEALGHYDAQVGLNDSLNEIKHGQTIVSTEIRYETQKKEKMILETQLELEKSQADRRRNQVQRNIIGGICVALLMVGWLVFRNLRQQRLLSDQQRHISEQRVEEILRTQELKLVNAMMDGQERERKRIAQDLHDRLGSMLSAIKMQFSALESWIGKLVNEQQQQFHHVFRLLDDAVAEVRRVSHDMVRGSLSQFGLKRTLEDLCASIETPGKLHVELSVFGMEERLDLKMEITIYRLVQEMVSNALKHSRADHLTIQLTRSEDAINLIVEDNGIGFDPKKVEEGMGMGNLRQRAAEFKGVVNIDSRKGRGTSISVDLPVR